MSKKDKKYVDVRVSDAKLRELKREQDAAVGMARYGRFKAWLHYANLNSWQEQKWHFAYLNYGGRELHCTCGLVIEVGATPEVSRMGKLNLDAAHRAKGHRKLPEFGEVVVAFIYDYKWMGELGVYYFDAFCQICGDFVLRRPGKEADTFAEIHNISCG